jgi:hypothetical protein
MIGSAALGIFGTRSFSAAMSNGTAGTISDSQGNLAVAGPDADPAATALGAAKTKAAIVVARTSEATSVV